MAQGGNPPLRQFAHHRSALHEGWAVGRAPRRRLVYAIPHSRYAPRQPFLWHGSKLGRNGETRRPAGAETGKRGGQPGPKRGNGGHKHWDDCARPRNIDYATTEGLGTTDAARFGSYLRSICLSEAEAWTCESSGCP